MRMLCTVFTLKYDCTDTLGPMCTDICKANLTGADISPMYHKVQTHSTNLHQNRTKSLKEGLNRCNASMCHAHPHAVKCWIRREEEQSISFGWIPHVGIGIFINSFGGFFNVGISMSNEDKVRTCLLRSADI